jgi:hypothetical protein
MSDNDQDRSEIVSIAFSSRHWELIRLVLDIAARSSRLWDLGLYEHKDLLAKLARSIANKIGRCSNGSTGIRDSLAHR